MEQVNDELSAMEQEKSLIGRAATPKLSQRLSQLLERVAAHYDSDTRQMVARMLSEYTGTVALTQNMYDRQKTLQTSLNDLSKAGLSPIDHAYAVAALQEIMHEGRITFQVAQMPNGLIRIKGRLTTGD